MAVAYVIAHEEGHNIQNELGWDQGGTSTEGLELDADCLAGAWSADAASRGVVDKQDLTEAKDTAWLVGDYAFDNPDHHGTPAQRQAAFTDGYTSLSSCRQYHSD
jgi:predicted metalloprotease